MKYTILLAALCLGILVGVALFTSPAITGAAGACYAENELCDCDEKECKCGNITLPASYCASQTA